MPPSLFPYVEIRLSISSRLMPVMAIILLRLVSPLMMVIEDFFTPSFSR